MDKKECNSCGKKFPLTRDYFHVHKGGKDGFVGKCKMCTKESRKEYFASDHYREQKKLAMQKWRADNPEKSRKSTEAYYKKNRERILEEQKWRYKNDPEYRSRKKVLEERYYAENSAEIKKRRRRRHAGSDEQFKVNEKKYQEQKAKDMAVWEKMLKDMDDG